MDTIFILVVAVTLAFLFGMIVGKDLERLRARNKQLRDHLADWSDGEYLNVPPPGPFDNARW